MATQRLYLGSFGPHDYEDVDVVGDPDGGFVGDTQHALVTEHQCLIGAVPTVPRHLLRLGDLTAILGGSGTDFTVVTAIQAGGAGGVGFQYKTRALTLTDGLIMVVGAESGWNDV